MIQRTALRVSLLALVLALGSGVRAADAALCSAADVMACGASCWSCVGSTCTLAKTLTVTPAVAGAACTFDFGTRDVVFKGGGLLGGTNTFEVRAHSLSLGNSGTLTATGKTVANGGTITLTLGAGGFTVASNANLVDVSGNSGGTLIVNSDGNVAIDGPGITADGTTGIASAGSILLTAGRQQNGAIVASGNITIDGKLTASGPIGGTNTGGGFGGEVSLTAVGLGSSGKIDVEAPIMVVGGPGGGGVDIFGTGNVTLGTTSSGKLIQADGTGDAGSGGAVNVTAGGAIVGNAGSTDAISAVGSAAAIAGNGGGCGGAVSLEAEDGPVTLGGTNGGLLAAGGPGGSAGSICVMTDTSSTDVTLDVPLNAGTTGANGLGGCITVSSNGAATLTDSMDVTGLGGGGAIQVSALTSVALTAVSKGLHADGSAGAGSVMLCASDNVTLGAPITATTASSDSIPGSVLVTTNESIALNAPFDVSSGGNTPGGCVDVEAGQDTTLAQGILLDADGGTSMGVGGFVTLLAGVPDLPGNLTLNGMVHARGSGGPPGAAFISLGGCTVQLGASAVLDSTGDIDASNEIVARTSLAVSPTAQVKTTNAAGSANSITLPVGAAAPPAAPFTPPPVVQTQPACKSVTDVNCLTPCPTCGDHVVQFPETCDNGAANGPCAPCSGDCRTFTCDDGDPCTVDTCDPIAGCLNTFIPGCTTSTSTSTTSSSSTTSSTSTTSTSTIPSTTSTTTTSTTASSTTTTSTSSTTTSTTTTSTTTTKPPTTSTSTTSTTTTSTTTSSTTTTTTKPPTTSTSTTTATTSTSGPSSTTTSSTSSTSSTTTTLGCATGPTLTAINCRLDALSATVGVVVPSGRLRQSLLDILLGARTQVAHGFGESKTPARAFNNAAKHLRRFDTKLESKAARSLAPSVKTVLESAANGIRTDVQALTASRLRASRHN